MIDYDDLAKEIKYVINDIEKTQLHLQFIGIDTLDKYKKQLQYLVQGEYHKYWKLVNDMQLVERKIYKRKMIKSSWKEAHIKFLKEWMRNSKPNRRRRGIG